MNVYSRAVNGTGQATRLTSSESQQFPETWSDDGQILVITSYDPPAGKFVMLDLGDPELRTTDLFTSEIGLSYAAVSPDGGVGA